MDVLPLLLTTFAAAAIVAIPFEMAANRNGAYAAPRLAKPQQG